MVLYPKYTQLLQTNTPVVSARVPTNDQWLLNLYLYCPAKRTVMQSGIDALAHARQHHEKIARYRLEFQIINNININATHCWQVQ